MRRFGLIGNPLTHSFSAKYFSEKFSTENISNVCYDLFELSDINQLPSIINHTKNLQGLNVTIPYKNSVMSYLNELDPAAKKIGAVNCIKITNGNLVGFNTDWIGFSMSLKNLLGNALPQMTFVLGSGGSSKAVVYVLEQLNMPYNVVSRKIGNNIVQYADLSFKKYTSCLIINTTPIGMFPHVEEMPPIPYHELRSTDFMYDLIYNPQETAFLKAGKNVGAHVKNGLEMLKIQAEESWKIWNKQAGLLT